MRIFNHAASVAEQASGTNVIAGAGITVATFHFSTLVSAAGFVLTLVYLWGAMPRFWRVSVAVYRGLFHRDWSLWDQLGNQPNPMKDD